MALSFFLVVLAGGGGVYSASAESEAFHPFEGRVTAENVHVRAGQSSNFESLGRLNEGQKVIVEAVSFSWYKIQLPATAQAYVSADYVRDRGDGWGQVMARRLNVRARPRTGGSLLGQLTQGDWVKILERKDGWLRIQPDSRLHGWVARDFVVFQKETQLARQAPQPPPLKPVVRNLVKPRSAPRPPLQPDARIQGVMRPLTGKAMTANVRHQIQDDQGRVYYLKGFRRVLDNFLRDQVRVEGRVVSQGEGQNPSILLVTRVQLVL